MVPHLTVLLSTSPGSEPHRDDGLGSTDSKHRSTDAEQVTVCEALTLSLSLSCHPKRAGELDHESDRLPAVCLSVCSSSTRITHGTDRRPSTISHKGNARGPIAFLLRPLRHLTANWQLAPAPTTLVFAFSFSQRPATFFFQRSKGQRRVWARTQSNLNLRPRQLGAHFLSPLPDPSFRVPQFIHDPMLGTFPLLPPPPPKAIGRSLFATAIRGGKTQGTGGFWRQAAPAGRREEGSERKSKGRAGLDNATAHANQTYVLVHEP